MSEIHPVLAAASEVAEHAFACAVATHSPTSLAEEVMDGADGTPTMRVDALVEDAILERVHRFGINVLSEERGWIDRGSALTLVVDPVDGSANAAAGVPIACMSAALVEDGVFTEALTLWLHTGRVWWGTGRDRPSGGTAGKMSTTGRSTVAGAAVSLLRPHERNRDAWWAVASRAGRVRVHGCSTFDAALVASGAVDAFADAGSDTHRLVDLAAALVLVPAAGGAVADAYGRAIEFDPDLTRRWSGVVAATPQLTRELCATIATARPTFSDDGSVPLPR
jgi:myo-inositol-1(or 4)-monophosphatase